MRDYNTSIFCGRSEGTEVTTSTKSSISGAFRVAPEPRPSVPAADLSGESAGDSSGRAPTLPDTLPLLRALRLYQRAGVALVVAGREGL
jgi:hypothetical protein